MEYHIRIKRFPKKVESLPNEVWKNTIYEKYMVSNYGRIKSIPIGNKHEKKQEEKGISCNYKDIVVICSKG